MQYKHESKPKILPALIQNDEMHFAVVRRRENGKTKIDMNPRALV